MIVYNNQWRTLRMADCHKYKQAGNSVSVPIIKSFADVIINTLKVVDGKQ